jgi:hypothetical protein
MWRTNVTMAREAAVAPYLEIRYEDLRAGATAPLHDAFAMCGLDVGEERCAELLQTYSLDRMASGATSSPIRVAGARSGPDPEPEGFFGRGEVGGWRSRWTARDRELFDAVAGDLLLELGYEPDRSWVGSPAARRRHALTTRASRALLSVGRRIGRRSERALRRLP